MPTTCYRIEVVAGGAPGAVAEQAVPAIASAFSSRAKELPSQAHPAGRVSEQPRPDGTTLPSHARAVQRLATNEDRRAAVDDLATKLDQLPLSWWEIRTHDCVHDLDTGTGTEPGGCPDDTTATRSDGTDATAGSVPEGI